MCLSVSTALIPGNLREKLTAIAQAKFDAVELYEPDLIGFEGSPGEVREIAFDLGLRICALQPFFNLACQPAETRQRDIDRLEQKFDLMQALGSDLLLVGSASVAQTLDDANRAVSDLRVAAERAMDRGGRLAYLGLPWAKIVASDRQAFDVVRAVDHASFGLALNSCFSLADGSKPAGLRDIPGEKIFHVQLSDTPRLEMDTRQPQKQFGLLPGLGSLNLASFVRVLSRAGYKGAWSAGHITEGEAESGGNQFAKDSYRALVNLLDAVSKTEPSLDPPLRGLPECVYASGFEFVEFATDEAQGDVLRDMLRSMCFRRERKHLSKSVELWRQGAINIVVNSDPDGFAHQAFKEHGPTVCDMGLRVQDAAQTVRRATMLGTPDFSQRIGSGELNIPAIRGVGGNVVHFIDEKSDLHRVWDIEFEPVRKTRATPPAGLRRIDHLAQTMRDDEMQSWLLYYTSTFEMAKSPIVDVTDPSGIVHSQAIESPEGEVRLNLNGAEGRGTLAAEFLKQGLGAGVQHIAFLTDHIFETSARLAEAGFRRLIVPENYYADVKAQFGLPPEQVARMQEASILYDRVDDTEYFQLYSQPIFNGFFFEIVERKLGYAGYGARNAPVRLAAQKRYILQEELSA